MSYNPCCYPGYRSQDYYPHTQDCQPGGVVISGNNPSVNGFEYVLHDGNAEIMGFVGKPKGPFLVIGRGSGKDVTINPGTVIVTLSGLPIVLNNSRPYAVFAFANCVFFQLGDPLSQSAFAGTTLEDTAQSGNGSIVTFTFAGAAGLVANQIEVYIDGVRQQPIEDYSVADNAADLDITFTTAPANGTELHFRALV